MAQFIAATKQHLATDSSEEFCQTRIYGNAKITAGVTCVRNTKLFEDGSKRNAPMKDKLLRLSR